MTDQLPDPGLDHPCPRCDAVPGEPCVDAKHQRVRFRTHTERKPQATP